MIHSFLIISIFVLSAVISSSVSYAQKGSEDEIMREQKPAPVVAKKDDDLNAEQIIEINKPALVSVWYHADGYYSYYSYTPKDTTMLSGSGFIFDSRGFVGTNYHVIDGLDSLMIKTSDGSFYNAELIYVDEKNDIALLKIITQKEPEEEHIFPAVKFANSDGVRTGQSVFAIGSPLGFEYTISEGIIAALRENEKVSFNDPQTYAPLERTFDKVIQITAAISPGNSGGALFNSKGEVIGITTYSYGFYGNLNFAIAINSFTKLRNSIDLASIENNEEFISKKQANLFNMNMRLAENFRTKIYTNWFYTKQLDTMKVPDTFAVKQDSLNKINFQKAEQYYNTCIALKPDSFYIYQNMMDLYVYVENFSKAEDLYKSIRERFNSDSLLNTLSSSLAAAYSTSKDYKKALMFYEKMQQLDTNDMIIRYQIANIYHTQKEYGKAETYYKKIIKKDPNYVQAYMSLGRLYYENNNYAQAKKYLGDAFEKSMTEESSYYTGYLDLHFYLGMIAVREGRKLEALMAYMDMKSIYTYTKEENEKKITLYKAIKKMEE